MVLVVIRHWTPAQGLKNHAVTMFEVGKLTDESMDSFLVELGKVTTHYSIPCTHKFKLLTFDCVVTIRWLSKLRVRQGATTSMPSHYVIRWSFSVTTPPWLVTSTAVGVASEWTYFAWRAWPASIQARSGECCKRITGGRQVIQSMRQNQLQTTW